jgi:hypothetical protein
MDEFINDIKPDINVREKEYKRLLGYPADYELQGRAAELADQARKWYTENGKPWVYAIKTNKIDIINGKAWIKGREFTSKKLYSQISRGKVNSVFLLAVSAGKECEEISHQLWEEGKPDEYFFNEIFGSAVVEHLLTNICAMFCNWAGKQHLVVLPQHSPGYSGWEISEQEALWDLICNGNRNILPGRIEVLSSGMLNPKKSLLAVFGISACQDKIQNLSDMIPCKTCSLLSCQYRRSDFKRPLRLFEDVSQLQNKAANC